MCKQVNAEDCGRKGYFQEKKGALPPFFFAAPKITISASIFVQRRRCR
jgi:hypothetical protein